MGIPYCDSVVLLLWVCTAAVSMWTQAPTLAWQAILTHYTIPQLGLVFQKLNRRKKIGCLHTIRKNTHKMQCMYESGRGQTGSRHSTEKVGPKALTFPCPLLLMSPAEGIASLNITFFVCQVRTTPHHTYSFEDMTKLGCFSQLWETLFIMLGV